VLLPTGTSPLAGLFTINLMQGDKADEFDIIVRQLTDASGYPPPPVPPPSRGGPEINAT